MKVREVEDADLAAVAEIYGHHVRHGVGSFEYEPPDLTEIRRRRDAIAGLGLPYIVAERDGSVVGFAHASPFRVRPAYRYAAEDSVYVHPDATGAGIGRTLLEVLIERCEAVDLRTLVAVIGGADERSIALHRACGYEEAARFPGLGWKHERWLDLVMMRRVLGAGATRPPAEVDPGS